MKHTINVSQMEQKARQIRATCVQITHDAQETHLSSALSCVDILVVLFNAWLRISPQNPKAPERDRFYLSKGHGCAALYAVLADRGFIPKEWLFDFARPGSPLPNHPCRHALPLLEISSGSLGHGLGIATGALYGLWLDNCESRAAVLMSDGECNEGSVWEAAMFAAAHQLDRLVAIIDYNGIQAVGRSDEIMGHTSLEEKFRSFGWSARTVNGNCIADLQTALNEIPFAAGKPSAIIARTRGGAGVSFMEDNQVWYYRRPSADDLARALKELGVPSIHKVANHA